MSTLLYVTIPAFVLLLGLEWALSRRHAGEVRGYAWRDTAASISMGLGNVAISAVTKAGAVALWTAAHRLAPIEIGWVWWAWC